MTPALDEGDNADGASDLSTSELAAMERDLDLLEARAPRARRDGNASLADLLARLRPLERPHERKPTADESAHRLAALHELGRWASERPLPFLVSRALPFATGAERTALLWYAGASRDLMISTDLAALMKAKDTNEATLAVLTWGRATSDAGVTVLLHLLDDGESPDEVRAAAALALAWRKEGPTQEGTDALLRAMATGRPVLARAAGRALAALGPASLAGEIAGRSGADPGSTFALTHSRWKRPLLPWVPWDCGRGLQAIPVLEALIGDEAEGGTSTSCP